VSTFLNEFDDADKGEIRPETSSLMHPCCYLRRKIIPRIVKNKTKEEIVWTYLVARKYENNHRELSRILCSRYQDIPDKSRIWIEAHLQPTRQNEGDCWETCADLSMGRLDRIENTKMQVQAGGDWVCICESKWHRDIDEYPDGTNQLCKIIEHALLLHNKDGSFHNRVYVTLITPKSFKYPTHKFFQRKYQDTFRAYLEDKNSLEEDLRKCHLEFLDYKMKKTVKERISALELNWVTFEELLQLPNLVEKCIPGKYRVTIDTWEEIFALLSMAGVVTELKGCL